MVLCEDLLQQVIPDQRHIIKFMVMEAKAKRKTKGKEKRKGCSIKFGDNGKPICMKFNVGACRANIKAGKRCVHGYHVCWKDKCNKPCAFHECTHKV